MDSPETSPQAERPQAKWWAFLGLLVAAVAAAVVIAFRLSPDITPLLETIR
jgi:hypothetical protein